MVITLIMQNLIHKIATILNAMLLMFNENVQIWCKINNKKEKKKNNGYKESVIMGY